MVSVCLDVPVCGIDDPSPILGARTPVIYFPQTCAIIVGAVERDRALWRHALCRAVRLRPLQARRPAR